MSIYLDYNSTTPLAPEVLEVISNVGKSHWMNPSSSYATAVRSTIKESRRFIGSLFNAHPADFIFTSGGTEANFTVFNTFSHFHFENKPQVITSNIEHPSVLSPLTLLAAKGRIVLTVIQVDVSTGVVNPEAVVSQILPDRMVLVSLMLANNETGAVMPIECVVQAIRQFEQKENEIAFREKRIYIHSDIAQAVGKIPVDLTKLGVDYATIVGHKFYGPRIGCLYIHNAHLLHRKIGTENCHVDQMKNSFVEDQTVPLIPLFVGGGQEFGLRAGTENTPMIAGLGRAAQLVSENLDRYIGHMLALRSALENELRAAFPSTDLHQVRICIFGIDRCVASNKSNSQTVAGWMSNNGTLRDHFPRLPNTVNVTFIGPVALNSRDILARCPTVQASRGAACHSMNQASTVLQACGYSSEEAESAIRLSLGRNSTISEVKQAVLALKVAVNSLVQESTQCF